MFSENEKISGRQLYRSIVVTLAGPTLLVCPRVAGGYGADGFFVYGIAGILSVLYIGFMLCIRKCSYKNNGLKNDSFIRGFLSGRSCVAGRACINVLLVAKLLCLAVGGLYLICDVVSGILLPETHILIVLTVVVMALIYWNQGSIESSGRAFEVLFYWVLIPVIIVIGMAMPKIEVANLLPQMNTRVSDIIAAGVFLWFLFTPAEILVLCGKHFRNDKKTVWGVWRGVFVLFTGNILTYATVLGIYGAGEIVEGSPYPLLKVMQISGVPGDFLRRVDGFMSVFLVLSLFCGMVLLLDYMGISIWQIGEALYGRREDDVSDNNLNHRKDKRNTVNKRKTSKSDKKRFNKKIIFSCVVTIFMAVSVVIIRNKISIKQPATGLSQVYSDKKIISSVELEERAFVMSVIIGESTVTFEIASDEEGKWQEESTYVTLHTGIVEEAEVLYKDSGEKRLDFTHMKMIFIEDSVYEDDITKLNITYMYEQERFAENVLVCPLEGDMVQMAARAIDEEEAFAVPMEKTMQNSERNEEMELYKVYRNLFEQ